ncbi:hypothetical protein ABIA39_000335 [Nocardia sp. GAS34]
MITHQDGSFAAIMSVYTISGDAASSRVNSSTDWPLASR